MKAARHSLSPQSGFSMIEVLVALVILLVGLLGLAGLMAQSQRSELESYQRVQAVTILQDMANRLNANRMAANCYAYTTAAQGTPSLGYAATYTPQCTVTQIQNYYALSQNPPYSPLSSPSNTDASAPAATAVADMNAWSLLLQGAAESAVVSSGAGAGYVGAMPGARGCISYDSTTELPEFDPQTGLPTGRTLLGTGIYTLSIAWQGVGDTVAPPGLTCGKNLYLRGNPPQVDDMQRRVVSLTVRMAALTK